tara:strand:+ start:3106 stop:3357 length:252 start_codon:yes stop_codon:yes gene_type:complete
MKKFIIMHSSELSQSLGVGVGFLNFYMLYYLWSISWEISFAIAFGLGFLVSAVSNHFLDNESDKHEAESISAAVREFEERPRN